MTDLHTQAPADHGMRPAFLAGQWYPLDAQACAAAIEDYSHSDLGRQPVKSQQASGLGLIAPHAGWIYSGAAMGQTFAAAAKVRADQGLWPLDEAELVIIFGSHKSPQDPGSVFLGQGWQTPLGDLQNDQDLARHLLENQALEPEPVQPSRPDNAVEVLLPFVKYFCPKAKLLMQGPGANAKAIGLGKATAKVAAEKYQRVFVVGSTDLSHYGPNYGFYPKGRDESAVSWVRQANDTGFIGHMLAGKPQEALEHALQERSACCPGAAIAALCATKTLAPNNILPKLVSHYLSYDIRPSENYVGYAGIIF